MSVFCCANELGFRERANQCLGDAVNGFDHNATWMKRLQVGEARGEHDLVAQALLGQHHDAFVIQGFPFQWGNGKARTLAWFA